MSNKEDSKETNGLKGNSKEKDTTKDLKEIKDIRDEIDKNLREAKVSLEESDTIGKDLQEEMIVSEKKLKESIKTKNHQLEEIEKSIKKQQEKLDKFQERWEEHFKLNGLINGKLDLSQLKYNNKFDIGFPKPYKN